MAEGADIVAIGARTPVGLGANGSAAAIRAGIQRLGEHPFIVDARGEPIRVARDALLDPKVLSASRRILVLARSALDEAIGSGLPHLASELGRQRVLEVVLALPEERPGFSDRDAAWVAGELAAGLRTPTGTPSVSVVARGHAGGLEGLRLAVERVVAGHVEICAVVGADSYLDTAAIDWLDSAQRIAADNIRGGFTPGEAGSCVLVANRAVTQKLNLRRLATVLAAESAYEPNGSHGDREGLGLGLTAAIVQATGPLAAFDGVDAVYCDINGERYRSDEWGFAVLRTGAALKTSDYVSAVRSCGDVGAASGPLLCGLAIRAWVRHYAAGPRILVWCSSERGLRAAVVLERGDDTSKLESVADRRR